MERTVKDRLRHGLLLLLFVVGLGAAFNPTQLSKYQTANLREVTSSPKQHRQNKKFSILPRLDRSFCTYAKSEDYDDDDEEISVEDDDWRAFRAKLVMGEKTASEGDGLSSSTRTSSADDESGSTSSVGKTDGQVDENVILDDGDLDGIGSIFRDDFADSAESESETEVVKNELTPLDPSQWAYDSGDVIEQGAVILGGIEQEVSVVFDRERSHAEIGNEPRSQ